MVDLGRLARANRLAERGEGRLVREHCGVSLRTLAAVLGTNPGELSRWERGLVRPRPASALRWLGEVERMRAELPHDTATLSALPDAATHEPCQVGPGVGGSTTEAEPARDGPSS